MKYSSSGVCLENFHLCWFSMLHQDYSSPHNTNLLWVRHWVPLPACEDRLPVALSEAELGPPHFWLKHLEKLRNAPPESQAAQMMTADLRQPVNSTHHYEILCSKSVHCRNSGLLTLALDKSPLPTCNLSGSPKICSTAVWKCSVLMLLTRRMQWVYCKKQLKHRKVDFSKSHIAPNWDSHLNCWKQVKLNLWVSFLIWLIQGF